MLEITGSIVRTVIGDRIKMAPACTPCGRDPRVNLLAFIFHTKENAFIKLTRQALHYWHCAAHSWAADRYSAYQDITYHHHIRGNAPLYHNLCQL